MIHFKNVSDLHKALSVSPPEHPFLGLLDGDNNSSCGTEIEFTADFYMISLKKMKSGTMLYGKTKYDHSLGSMTFTKPRQIIAFNKIKLLEKSFYIIIHEDYLKGSSLHNEIKKYNYFEYETNEALHLSPSEENIMWDFYNKLKTENSNNTDEYSKEIILSEISTLLKYAQRFYKRQFINRTELAGTTVTKFNRILDSHFQQNKLTENKLPSVKEIADKLFISSRYLSDLLKQETGKTALELIHIYLISEAKNLLTEGEKNIAEISYELGFENPTYFSRLFKRETGLTPINFRTQFLN